MDIRVKTQGFVDTYENIFHHDWAYSAEMLGGELFEEDETFIQCEWISNWCNKDSLDSSFDKLKKGLDNLSLGDDELLKLLEDFILNIEIVFDSDWKYTKLNLNIEVSIISADATFLHPKISDDELEIENWGYRERFLKQYREIKNSLS